VTIAAAMTANHATKISEATQRNNQLSVAVTTTTARATKRVTRVTKAATISKNIVSKLRHGRVSLRVAVQ
jgi:hypothetical protein